MGIYLEFVVPGPPISNQQRTRPGKANLRIWRATVAAEARDRWAKPLLAENLKAIIINFHAGDQPSVDLDNMSKPILDVLEEVVYHDDRQVRQAEITHLELDEPYSILGVSKVLAAAIQAGIQFVYVRIEDPTNPFPLPK